MGPRCEPRGKEVVMLSPKPELIWQGRIHLGDEAGVFGDAFYSGLTTELPVTMQKTDPLGQTLPR
jgi:hypothetical protein